MFMTIVAEHGLQNCARGGQQDLSSYKVDRSWRRFQGRTYKPASQSQMTLRFHYVISKVGFDGFVCFFS